MLQGTFSIRSTPQKNLTNEHYEKANLNLKAMEKAGSEMATSSPSETRSLILLPKFGRVCFSKAGGA